MTYILIIPIFNEEQNIINLINVLSKSFLINDENCIKILLVNDGSDDNSEEIIKSEIKDHRKIVSLNHKKNMGYGAAIITGINYSKNLSNYSVFSDSDLTNPIDDIKKMTVLMDRNVDYIQANRYTENTNNIQPHRKFIGVAGNFLCRFFMNMNIGDYTNGFRAIKTDLLVNFENEENGFAYLIEEINKVSKKAKSYAEVPYILSVRNDLHSKSKFTYSIFLPTNFLAFLIFLSLMSQVVKVPLINFT